MNRREAIRLGTIAGASSIIGGAAIAHGDTGSIKTGSKENIIAECITACSKCYNESLQTDKFDASFAACIQATLDCMTICQTMMNLEARQSALVPSFAQICIQACEACILACSVHTDDACVECADVCRTCIEYCKTLV